MTSKQANVSPSHPVHVLKFGGSSLANADGIERAIEIMRDRTEDHTLFVVVSALEGVTNKLFEIGRLAPRTPDKAAEEVEALHQRHLNLLETLAIATPENRKVLEQEFEELRQLITPNSDMEYGSWHDRIISTGEKLSSFIFAEAVSRKFAPAKAYLASQFIRTNRVFGSAEVDEKTTGTLIRETFAQIADHIPIITGFIGSTVDNEITTLGRSGSDYTAGIIAEALRADKLEIWTDVDGVMSADPRLVETAVTINQLNYEDMAELSLNGAKVVHPKTVNPLKSLNIPLEVRNSFHPEHPGTLIRSDFPSNGNFRSITKSGPFTFVVIKADPEQELAEVVTRAEELIAGQNIVIQSRLVQYRDHHAVLVLDIEQVTAYPELQASLQEIKGAEIHLREEVYQLKLFNNRLLDDNEFANRVFRLLNARHIKTVDFINPDNRRYVSLFLKKEDVKTAARLINDHFCIDDNPIHLFVAGIGTIGGRLLEQIRELDHPRYNLKVIGVCNSRRMAWNQHGINLSKVSNEVAEGAPTDWEAIIEQLTQPHRHQQIFVDATGDPEVAREYPRLLKNGIHIVTPSKQANTFEQEYFRTLMELSRKHDAHYHFETTAGAGLPVISTIADLVETGDTITEVSGVLSGTMNYLFDELEQGKPFSEIIRKAKEEGYSEPDPRDDLSGEDVARKFIIMARVSGLEVERAELEVESLCPADLSEVDLDQFFEGIAKHDSAWQSKIELAQSKNETLRYVGRLKAGQISIGVESVPKNSPLGQLSGSDNLIEIKSNRYAHSPIIVQGPGAGRDVTAGGVLADVMKIASLIAV